MRDQATSVGELMKTSGRKLYTLLYRISLSAEAAEDLLQDLAVRLMRSPGFRAAKSPEAFAIRAAQRLAFDWLRRQKRKGAAYSALAEQGRGRFVEDPAKNPARDDDILRVLSALDRLSAAQRECIVLRFLQGKEYPAIAEMTGSTPHRVRATISKGIGRLQALLDRDGAETEPALEGKRE